MPRNLLRVVVVLSLFLHPILAGAASPSVELGTRAQLTVDDVVAGFETIVRVTGLLPGATVELHVVSPSGEDTVIPVQADIEGIAEGVVPARLTEESGTYRAFALDGRRKISTETSFEVLSDRIDTQQSTITVSDALLPTDGQTAVTVTVTLRDTRGNPLPGRPVQLVGSRAEDRITPLRASRESDRDGRVQFAVHTWTPGEIALRAIDLLSGTMLNQVGRIAAGSIGGFVNERPAESAFWNETRLPVATRYAGSQFRGQLIESVATEPPAYGTSIATGMASDRAYDVVDHFEVTVSTPTVKVRDVIPNFKITAVDARGKTVESYTGRVRIDTPGDPHATRPGLAADHGEATIPPKARGDLSIPWSLSFSRAGEQLIVVTDETGTMRGQTTVSVTDSAEIDENRRIRLENLHDGDTVNSRNILLQGKGPALANLHVWTAVGSTLPEEIMSGRSPDAIGETEQNGTFLMSIVLPEATEVVLEIRDQNGQYDSGLIRLRIDTDGPQLQVRFDPEQPHEGDDVTLTVTSEPGLSDVTLAIRDQTITLTDIGGSDEGTRYQALFPAPARGDAEYVISGRDPAGNVADVRGQLAISGPSIPQVQNVDAQPLAGGIQLQWDEIPDPTITGYRIETKSPAMADAITLDTPKPTDGAAIMGLKAGTDYYLSVRALRGGEEGPRSALITSRTLGMEVAVTPQEGGFLLQWTFPDTTPLSAFVLEYGSTEAEYSEVRMLDGGMRVYTVKDLLPQPYLIRLTPIATTGDILHDLAVTTQGTPLLAVAFQDELLRAVAPDNALHAGAGETPGSGLPGLPWQFVLGLTAIPAGWYWYRRHKGMRQMKAFLRGMERRYYS